MTIIEIETGVSGYADLVNHVLKNGTRRDPRGIATLDAGWTTVVMRDVQRALPLGIGRNVNRRIAAVEALQLMGAFSDPALTIAASKNFAQFTEPNGTFHGAYGKRIGTQLAYVLRKLKHDRDTRQAVITLWDADMDNIPDKKDYPCTTALIFSLIDDRLELNVTMRSQDVWLGTPYDWFQFTQLQQTAAKLLDVWPGIYRHTTVSTHLYSTNFDDTARLTEPPSPSSTEWQPLGFDSVDITNLYDTARSIARGDVNVAYLSRNERWYHEQITPLLG